MPFILSDEEMSAVRRALDNYLPELAFEIARIDLERDRHELGRMERTLKVLRARLVQDASIDRSLPV